MKKITIITDQRNFVCRLNVSPFLFRYFGYLVLNLSRDLKSGVPCTTKTQYDVKGLRRDVHYTSFPRTTNLLLLLFMLFYYILLSVLSLGNSNKYYHSVKCLSMTRVFVSRSQLRPP